VNFAVDALRADFPFSVVHRFVAALLFSAAHRCTSRRDTFPEIREIVVAGMAVGPSDVDASSRRHVHLYTGGFSSFIETYGHLIAILPEG